jgi:glycosyltransferase involved in cell wall biosynthesis
MGAAVSVVIPAYRAQDFIERPVQSVLGQTLPDWEVVVVSDDGVDYAKYLRGRGIQDGRIRSVSTGRTGSGAAHARNVGLDAAGCRIVATLDSDDALAGNALEVLVPLAERHGAAYSDTRFLDHGTGADLPNLERRLGSGLVGLEDILTSHIHTYAGIVFDKDRVKARWPDWMARWEDVCFFAGCFDDIDRMYHVAEPLYLYYRREGSICNRSGAAAEYLGWAERVAGQISRGERIGIRSAAARTLLGRFLRGWQRLEARFEQELSAGRCRDFQEFLGRNTALVHALGP